MIGGYTRLRDEGTDINGYHLPLRGTLSPETRPREAATAADGDRSTADGSERDAARTATVG